jgi:gelsolin
LYRIRKKPGHHPARCFEVPLKCSSLNDGDAFLLDAGDKIYTWFGSSVSAFERNKSASVAHNLHQNRLGHCDLILGVEDDNEEFWSALGGKGEIQPAVDDVEESEAEKKMYICSNESGKVTVKLVELSRDSLESNRVCLVDAGTNVYIWVGKESSKDEQQFAMMVVQRYLKALERDLTTCVTRVNEGCESRCKAFGKVF